MKLTFYALLIAALLAFALAPLLSGAQILTPASFTVGAGATLKMSGDAKLVLSNMNFILGKSTVTLPSGEVIMTGDQASYIDTRGDSNFTAFSRLTIDKTAGETQLGGDLTIWDTLTIRRGNLLLGQSHVDLQASGWLKEESDSFGIVTVVDSWVQARADIPANTWSNPGNLGLEIKNPVALPGTVVLRMSFPTPLSRGKSISRGYVIQKTVYNGINASVRFHYKLNELTRGDTAQSPLALYSYIPPSGQWTDVGKDGADYSAHWVYKTGLTSLELFTLADTSGSVQSQGGSVSLYPNPNTGIFNVLVNTPEARTFLFSVVDHNGLILQRQKLALPAGKSSIPFNITGSPPGIYLLQYGNGTSVSVIQFQKN